LLGKRFRLREENPLRHQSLLHDALCFFQDAAQVVFSAEALGINLVDISAWPVIAAVEAVNKLLQHTV
jgi:hypothetical protein